jgi:DNA (cytosine-5)-methyltransferase 1
MRATDFFCGAGGFSEGAKQAGIEVTYAANHQEVACKFHKLNHPETRTVQQDLQQANMADIGNPELLLASPACQGHSENSQPARKGTGGSHSPNIERAAARTIIQRETAYAVLAAAEVARPDTIIVENVPKFLKWEMFPAWQLGLELCGYVVRTRVLNASAYGSASDRLRAVVTARQGTALDLDPQWGQGPNARALGDCIERDYEGKFWTTIESKSDRMQWRMRKAQREAGSFCCWNNVSESRGRTMEDYAPTLTTKSDSQFYVLDGDRCRIANTSELALAMDFPESYIFPRNRSVAGTMIGNAIPVSLARGLVEQAIA